MTCIVIISITEVIIYLRQVEVLQRVELLHDLLPQLLPLGLVNHPDADVEAGVHRLVITDLTENIILKQRTEQREKIMNSAGNRLIGEVVQSQRRPLLGPSAG